MTNIVRDWRPFFPLKNVRPEQGKFLDSVLEFYENDGSIAIAELGTGVGKSAIAVTLSRFYAAHPEPDCIPGSYILTSQKILEDQYMADYPYIADVRSSANYNCSSKTQFSCGEVSRIKKFLPTFNKGCSGSCYYLKLKTNFMLPGVSLTNYAWFLSEAAYTDDIDKKSIIIMDEAHNVEDEVRKWASLDVTEDMAKALKLKLPAKDKEMEWLGTIYKSAISVEMIKLKSFIESNEGKANITKISDSSKMYDLLDKIICKINRITEGVGGCSDYLVQKEETSVKFIPIDISKSACDFIYSKGSKVLLMSATILNESIYASSVGLNMMQDRKRKFWMIPSPFKKEAFGFKYVPVGKINVNVSDETLNNLREAVKYLLEEHKTEKGIIHCTNYQITKIMKGISSRLLIQESSADRDTILKLHFTSKEPTVLVSPSMMEGLDLKDDLGRFQIICKLPFPYLGDPVVKKLAERNPKWYAWRTARALVQSVGRCIRSSNDYASTYLLDGCYDNYVRQWHGLIPFYMK